MNGAGGFIVLQRKIMDWEWFGDANTLSVFIHLLLMANYEDSRFMGRVIKRGQVVTSLSSLGKKTGLSFQQTRTALSHMLSTGEITSQAYPQYRVITIVNYDKYQTKQQAINKQPNKLSTREATSDQQHHNNNNNINKEKKERSSSCCSFAPPTLDEVTTYVQEIHSSVDPGRFYDYYESNGWKLKGGQKMQNWKAALRNWTRRDNDGNGNRDGRSSQQANGENQDYSDLPGIVYL